MSELSENKSIEGSGKNQVEEAERKLQRAITGVPCSYYLYDKAPHSCPAGCVVVCSLGRRSVDGPRFYRRDQTLKLYLASCF